MYRKTYAKVDLDVLKDNIKEIVKSYDYKYYFGIVKANAYGHGDYIINSLIEGGVNYLAASSLEECLSIRKRNSNIPILCLEPIDLEFINVCVDNDITITIENLDYFKSLNPNKKLKFHLKIDSGMNRLGLKDKNEVLEIFNNSNPNLIFEGIYTHFATNGVYDKNWDNQLDRFKEITSLIDLSKIKIVHLGRSLTLVSHKMPSFVNGTRLGIIMYGFNSSISEPTGLRKIKKDLIQSRNNISKTTLTNNLKLKTALTLHSEVISLRKVKKGEFVGYGTIYEAKEDIIVATIPIGFADGFIKQNSGRYIKINDKNYQVIGEIGMDMISVKVDESVKLHNEVILYDDIKRNAKELGISAYMLLTSITNRVPRVYGDVEIKY